MDEEKPVGASTFAAHAGREQARSFRSVNLPVYRASTILFKDLEALESNKTEYTYGRRGTPSSRGFEAAINALEGGARTVLVPSGLAACSLAILTVCRAGDHLLMTDSTYGPTRTFCDRTLRRFGIETTYYDPGIGSGIRDLMRPNTRAVFLESPGSLTFEVQDLPAIAAAAHAHGASVLIDNTWATPLLHRPLALGADLSIQSVTKYIAGHADLLMGYVCANESHAERLFNTHGDLGQFSSGDDIFLALRGLRTLPTRLPRHAATAMTLARWFQARPEVDRVLYPPLEDDPGHDLWRRDFVGASGLFGVVLKPATQGQLAALMDHLAFFGMGWSWGGFESLITPAHITRTAKPFEAAGPVIRIHAGLEDASDLIADLTEGFMRMARAR